MGKTFLSQDEVFHPNTPVILDDKSIGAARTTAHLLRSEQGGKNIVASLTDAPVHYKFDIVFILYGFHYFYFISTSFTALFQGVRRISQKCLESWCGKGGCGCG